MSDSPVGLSAACTPECPPQNWQFHLLIRSRHNCRVCLCLGAPFLGNPPIWKLLNSDCLKYSPLISQAAHSGEGAGCCSEFLGCIIKENNWGP